VTAYRWFRAGKLPVKSYQTQTGTIIVEPQDTNKQNKDKSVYIYGRVSSYDKKNDLNRQVQRCLDFSLAQGLSVTKIIKEVTSGMNDKRPLLMSLLKMKPDIIIIEHKDRLTRFGFNYIETLLNLLGCEIKVINRDQEEKEDLMKDLISIITSFCCRLYGLRRGRKKVKEVKEKIYDNS
jgi:predicted site-specific integrase-resolvase